MGHKRRQTVSPEVKRVRAYRERNRILKVMGFDSFAEYLKSDLWHKIRQTVLCERPKCFVCGRPATQVHHRSYRKNDLEGRDLRRLFSLCSGCHFRIEFRDRDHEKLNPAQATAKMKCLATVKQGNTDVCSFNDGSG